jgi:uncharacterized protein (TIGR03545 family)
MRILRWKAIGPFCLLLCVLVLGWWLFLDRMVARSVEIVGADLVGARVDVESADVNLAAGRVAILGLQAANPDSPMRNLVEAEELVADVRVGALLRKKMVIEQISARGVRFGTERAESGELENPSPESGLLMRRISGWADQVRIPELSLESLGDAVNVDAISVDSLRTPALARATVASADSSRNVWEQSLGRLDPQPTIDSAASLVQRLNGANPLSLGLAGARDLAGSARNTLNSVRGLENNLSALDGTVRSGVSLLQSQVQQLAATREADIRYATSLLQLPSLDSPDLSPNLFGGLAVARMERVLYWLGQAERFLPPGLNPRRIAGSDRARMAGTTVKFPDEYGDPDFLIESADADLEIGGTGGAAGQYAARLTGFTNQPAVYGEPLTFFVERTGGAVGPSDVSVSAFMDHVGEDVRDSLAARIQGVSLPGIDLHSLGASLNLSDGSTELALHRAGDSLVGSWKWSSSSVEWARLSAEEAVGSEEGETPQVGQMAQDFLWRAVSGLQDVEIEVRFSGSVRGPSLAIGSNVGRAVASSLRRELGREIDRAEQQVRTEVDRLVNDQVSAANDRVDALQTDLESRIGVQLSELTTVREELERAIRRLVPVG